MKRETKDFKYRERWWNLHYRKISLSVSGNRLKDGKSESEAWTEHLGENPYNKGDGRWCLIQGRASEAWKKKYFHCLNERRLWFNRGVRTKERLWMILITYVSCLDGQLEGWEGHSLTLGDKEEKPSCKENRGHKQKEERQAELRKELRWEFCQQWDLRPDLLCQ